MTLRPKHTASVLVMVAVAAVFLPSQSAHAQNWPTAFIYQGQVKVDGVPLNGTADFRFTFTFTGDTTDVLAVPVTHGLFTAAVDFGALPYAAAPFPLGVAIRYPAGVGSYVAIGVTTITASPYSVQTRGLFVNEDTQVGIGTFQPTARLHVQDDFAAVRVQPVQNGNSSFIELNNYDSTVRGLLGVDGPGLSGGPNQVTLATWTNHPLKFFTNGGERMAITNTGTVGIGTASPEGRLHVLQGSAGTVTAYAFSPLVVESNGQNFISLLAPANQGRGIFFGDPGNNVDGGIVYDALVANGLEFRTNGNNPRMSITDAGNVGIGTNAPTAKLDVRNGAIAVTNAAGQSRVAMNVDGADNGVVTSDIVVINGGSDIAEPYDVAPAGDAQPIPGMVVSIDPAQVGKLRVSVRAYDRTVAGIISGANGINPGLTLGQKGTVADGEMPVANLGRVWCYVDADEGGPVAPGDLLTTSATPGHAMRVTDHSAANGAVLGKAMSTLESGRGMVLVLVSLQ